MAPRQGHEHETSSAIPQYDAPIVRGAHIAALLSLAILTVLLWALRPAAPPGPGEDRGGEIVMYCAAGLRLPVEELIREYEARYGVVVRVQYGGSGTMLSALQAARQGDLYLSADDGFMGIAEELELVEEVLPVAELRAVIGVPTGNPLGISGVSSLLEPGVRLGIGAESTAIGRTTQTILEASGTWGAIEEARKVSHPTVNQLGTDVTVGSLDAAIIWDATARQYDLEPISTPELEAAPRQVQIGVLSSASSATAALRLARFLTSRDIAGEVLQRHGFRPAGQDTWSEAPRLELMCGAMLNAAIDETLRAWAEREGVVIDFKYNGCGLLVDEMRARKDGHPPDAYFSCDQSFLDMVQPLFGQGIPVSSNPLIIVTQAGNPKKIQDLAGLSGEGLRIGLAHPAKSALGALTHKLLVDLSLSDGLAASGNVKLESPTGDTLVNQLRTGSLDAVVVYASNAARAGLSVERAPILHPGARATQPFAVGNGTEHPLLLRRMLQTITSKASRVRFEDLGFAWELDAAVR